MDINDFSLVKIRKTLPFSLDTKQVIYIEKEHNERLDKSIRSVDYAKNLIHLQRLAESFLENGVMDYYNPSHSDVSFDHLYDWFLDNVVDSSEITHGLLNYTGSQNKDVYFCYFINLPSDYDVSNIDWLIDAMLQSGKSFYKSHPEWQAFNFGIRYSVGPSEDNPIPTKIDSFTQALIDELVERVDKLQQKGISLEVIHNIIGRRDNAISTKELSKVVVDARYRIFLPDYNDMEVRMTPLVKTVYVFFLRHPEGVLLKNMSDFHKELFSIYNHITAFSDNEEIKNAISRLCDPTDNSMIEKCSRIKQVFTNLFDKDLAEYYIVSGGRNVKKHIKLDASMVIFITSKYKPANK